MAIQNYTQRLFLEPDNTHRLASLCGHLNEHLKQIEKSLGLKVQNRGNEFKLTGSKQAVEVAGQVLSKLYEATANAGDINPDSIHLVLKEAEQNYSAAIEKPRYDVDKPLILKTPNTSVKPRGAHQQDYVESIYRFDINFGMDLRVPARPISRLLQR